RNASEDARSHLILAQREINLADSAVHQSEDWQACCERCWTERPINQSLPVQSQARHFAQIEDRASSVEPKSKVGWRRCRSSSNLRVNVLHPRRDAHRREDTS